MGFNSPNTWGVVQLAARLTLDQKVLGSSPSTPASRPVNPAFFMDALIGAESLFFPRYFDVFECCGPLACVIVIIDRVAGSRTILNGFVSLLVPYLVLSISASDSLAEETDRLSVPVRRATAAVVVTS